jgi:hypothetical protein
LKLEDFYELGEAAGASGELCQAYYDEPLHFQLSIAGLADGGKYRDDNLLENLT